MLCNMYARLLFCTVSCCIWPESFYFWIVLNCVALCSIGFGLNPVADPVLDCVRLCSVSFGLNPSVDLHSVGLCWILLCSAVLGLA